MRRLLCLLFALNVLGLAVPGTTVALAAPADAPEAPLLTIVAQPGVTLSVDGRAYAGRVVVAADPGGGLDVVNRVDFEQYVEGIGEVPSNWPAAALEAQAVAARTYALWTVLTHPANAAGGQICASDACQVYVGLAKTHGSFEANWAAAVSATSGQVLQYQGDIIEALYGSSDGGRTQYGGVPWLPAVDDPQDSLAPEHQWSWSAPLSTLAAVLGVPAGQSLVSLVSSTTQITETLKSTDGTKSTLAVSPDTFHSLVNRKMAAPEGLDLPLPSYRYSVSTYGQDVRIDGRGDGNGLGLSQYRALGKAMAGWSAPAILGNYYAGTTLGPLAPGHMPATIGVTLAAGTSAADVAANGPVSVFGPSGSLLSSSPGPAGWVAAAGPGGVRLNPSSSVAFPAHVGDSTDAAPIPMRVAPPARPGASAAPGRADPPTTTTPLAPTTTTTTSVAPAPAVQIGARQAAGGVPPPAPPKHTPTFAALLASGLLALTIGLALNQRKNFSRRSVKPVRSTGAVDRSGNSLQ